MRVAEHLLRRSLLEHDPLVQEAHAIGDLTCEAHLVGRHDEGEAARLQFTHGIQYLADQRLSAVGLKPLYGVSHPIKWVDDFSKFNDQKTNFFEGTVTNYSKGSLSFDDF